MLDFLAFLLLLIVFVPFIRNWFLGIANTEENTVGGSINIIEWILRGGKNPKKEMYGDARWMNYWEREKVFKKYPKHTGWSIQGQNQLHLSHDDSTRHLFCEGGSGAGKTERFGVYQLQNLQGSAVVMDPGGDLFNRCSGSLIRRGYQVDKLDLEDRTFLRTKTFNIFDLVRPDNIDLVAHVLTKSAVQGNSENGNYWTQSTQALLSVLIKVMMESPRCHGKRDLTNLLFLLNNMGNNGRRILAIVDECSSETKAEYRGVIEVDSRTLSNTLSTARSALSIFKGSNPLARMCRTTPYSIKFDDLRTKKTVLFINAREQKQSFFAPFLNTFWTLLFEYLINNEHAHGNKQPVKVILDEFSNCYIPNFESIISTARRFNVSLALLVQSLSQLEQRYGHHGAKIIWDNCYTRLFLGGGISDTTAPQLEQILGQETVPVPGSKGDQYMGRPLMRAAEIGRLEYPHALMLQKGKRPVKIKMVHAHKDRLVQERSAIPPPRVEYDNRSPMQYIALATPDILEQVEYVRTQPRR